MRIATIKGLVRMLIRVSLVTGKATYIEPINEQDKADFKKVISQLYEIHNKRKEPVHIRVND